MTARAWNAMSGDWNVAANWSPAGVPDATDDVTINSGAATATSPIFAQSIALNGVGVLRLESAGASTVGSIVNGGALTLDDDFNAGGSTLTLTGTLTNSGTLQIGAVYKAAGVAPTSVVVNALVNSSTSTITLFGPTASTSLVVHSAAGFGTSGVLSGTVQLIGQAAIIFDSGAVTSIASDGVLVLDTADAQVLIAPDVSGNSALAQLASNAGTLSLYAGASLEISGDYSNSGVTYIDNSYQTSGSRFTVDGTFTNNASGEVDLGNLYNDSAHPAGQTNVRFGGLENAGHFYLNASSAVAFVVDGPLDNSGLLVIGTGNLLLLAGALTGAGAITLQAGAAFAFGVDVAPADLAHVTNQGGELVFAAGSVFDAGGQTIDVSATGLYQHIVLMDIGSIVNATIDVEGGLFDLQGGVLGGLAGGVALTIGSGVQQEVAGAVLLNGTLDNEGAVNVDADDLLRVEGAVTGTGAINLTGAADLWLDGAVGAGQTITLGSGVLTLGDLPDFHATIDGLSSDARIDLRNVRHHSGDAATLTTGNVLEISLAGGLAYSLQLDPTQDFTGRTFTLYGDGFGGSYLHEAVACFLAGTPILTDKGEAPIETLEIGDLVVTLSGERRSIKWIGRRDYSARFARNNGDVHPVCFKAGSLGDDTPRRDLWVSPKHAMYLDGVLISAERLVNGASIVQPTPGEDVRYLHIELETHDVLVASGAASESFVDDDSRCMFFNAASYDELYQGQPRGPAVYFAPRVEEGHVLARVRRRLDERAGFPVSPAFELGALQGEIEILDAEGVSGWTLAPVCLEVRTGRECLGYAYADRLRADGRRGFALRFAAPLDPERLSRVIVGRALDGAPLRAAC